MLQILPFACLISVALGHSWLTCVDYLEQNGEYWAGDLCRAAPRHGHTWAPVDGLFGLDTGFDHRPSESEPCKTARDDIGAYDAKNPMAVYYPGQKIIITHPTKNHVSDVRCTSRWLTDFGNKLYVGPKDGTSDLTLSGFFQNEIADFGRSPYGPDITEDETTKYPKPGFQNAPAFCEGTDKALGTYTWFLDPNLQPGQYTFMWAWWFNNMDDLYTGCFEAKIVANRAERDAILRSRGQTTADPIDISGGAPATRPPDVTGPAVDGGWGDWEAWGECSTSCGGGQQMRVRHCDNPFPSNGGKYCEGLNEEFRSCSPQTCPPSDADFIYTSNWGSGANADIWLPNPRPVGQWVAKMTLPCPVGSVSVWHANDVSIASEEAQGIHRFEQVGWHLEKDNIGMTLQFAGCNPKEEEVNIQIVPK